MLSYAVAAIFVAIIVSLVWARLRFFRVNTGTAWWMALGYDLAVAMHMALTVWLFASVTGITESRLYVAAGLYTAALALFWWSIVTAKSLDFAFSEHVGSIVITGPFGLVRHPFYVSYMMAWVGSAWLFNHPVLWLTAGYLGAFYVLSAQKEERLILKSEQAERYRCYQQQVGMFLPRKRKWKQSSSEP